MNAFELRNASEFNRDKALREEAMSSKYLFGSVNPVWAAEREHFLAELFGNKNTRI